MKINKYSISFGLSSSAICTLLFLLIPLRVQAGQLRSNIKSTQAKKQLISQAFVDSRCPEEYVYLLGSTRNFKVTICGSRGTGNPTHYIADSKNGSGGIFLPLSSYTEERFVARNGKYTYTLIIDKGGNGSGRLIIKAPGKRPQSQKFEMELP